MTEGGFEMVTRTYAEITKSKDIKIENEINEIKTNIQNKQDINHSNRFDNYHHRSCSENQGYDQSMPLKYLKK